MDVDIVGGQEHKPWAEIQNPESKPEPHVISINHYGLCPEWRTQAAFPLVLDVQ